MKLEKYFALQTNEVCEQSEKKVSISKSRLDFLPISLFKLLFKYSIVLVIEKGSNNK